MRMQKRTFRIGQLAKNLQVERFVVRFWEKEFGIKTTRSVGGQRFYTEDDLRLFQQVKKLLYEDGYTIAGAKKILKHKNDLIVGSHKTTFEHTDTAAEKKIKQLSEQIVTLKSKLKELKELL